MGKPWKLGESRLYHSLDEQKGNQEQQKELFKRMRTGLLEDLENLEEFDFIRDRQEFKALLAKFRDDNTLK